jgi:hypothetical protein
MALGNEVLSQSWKENASMRVSFSSEGNRRMLYTGPFNIVTDLVVITVSKTQIRPWRAVVSDCSQSPPLADPRIPNGTYLPKYNGFISVIACHAPLRPSHHTRQPTGAHHERRDLSPDSIRVRRFQPQPPITPPTIPGRVGSLNEQQRKQLSNEIVRPLVLSAVQKSTTSAHERSLACKQRI